MHSTALCSAQTTISPLKMLIFILEGVVCSGEFRIHNPKVGGSIPPPATNKINSLGGGHLPPFCYCGDFCVGPRLPLRKRLYRASQTLVGGVSVTRRCLNASM